MKRFAVFLIVCLLLPAMTQAQGSISYASQPNELAIFLNNVAFAQDDITLPGGVDVSIVLPAQVYPETIVLRENGERVPNYRLQRQSDGVAVRWQTTISSDETRDVRLTYLLTGISWTPRYDMWLTEATSDTVEFDFFAEITNQVLPLQEANVRLIAGRVDTNQQINDITRITTNQYIAGYDESAPQTGNFGGTVTVQHVYTLDPISALPGDIIYQQMTSATLPARRLLLWNANTDQQVSVIYKVRNESDLPFAEGITRSYQDGLFVGSDFIELTPIGSEGSVTIGTLQNVRVNRTVTRTAIPLIERRDTQYDVVLSLSNFGDEALTIEIVDRYPPDAINVQFSDDPERQAGNLFRWEVTLQPGDSQDITYTFVAD